MKRIITCSDGTWNKVGCKDGNIEVQTNVEKMYKCICHEGQGGVLQLKAYDEGVGTGLSMKDRLIGGATGAGIDKNIKDLYLFIALSYQPGDEIWLFGFSRGAYTARSIAGFIRCCGVLRPDYIHLIDKAYELYRDRNNYTTPDSDMMQTFRSNYCYEDITPIKFIGVWDTVGSLGIPLPAYKMRNMHRYKFHDVTLSKIVEYAYHALAIDEKRSLFEPTLWEQSKSVSKDNTHPQVMEQRWFAGVHSNVGGGYADNGLSNIALQWIIDKAAEVGLCFTEPPLITPTPYDKGALRNSYTSMYWFWKPKRRKISLNDGKSYQTLDDSVKQRMDRDKTYRPDNLKGI